jgi:hypothetical protein
MSETISYGPNRRPLSIVIGRLIIATFVGAAKETPVEADPTDVRLRTPTGAGTRV